jgi:hypothetical protein
MNSVGFYTTNYTLVTLNGLVDQYAFAPYTNLVADIYTAAFKPTLMLTKPLCPINNGITYNLT